MPARKAVVNISCNYHQYYTVHTILKTWQALCKYKNKSEEKETKRKEK